MGPGPDRSPLGAPIYVCDARCRPAAQAPCMAAVAHDGRCRTPLHSSAHTRVERMQAPWVDEVLCLGVAEDHHGRLHKRRAWPLAEGQIVGAIVRPLAFIDNIITTCFFISVSSEWF